MDCGRWKDALPLLVFGVILYALDYIMDILNFVEQKYYKDNHWWADCILFFVFTTHLIAASSDGKDAYYAHFKDKKEFADRYGDQPPSKVAIIKDVCLAMFTRLIQILLCLIALPFALCSALFKQCTGKDKVFGRKLEFGIGSMQSMLERILTR